MPTGYTAAVQDGKITELSQFAIACARAFGACILMRDDPPDAEIPQEFKPSEYYVNSVAEHEERVAKLKAMTDEQVLAAIESERVDVLRGREKGNAESKLTRERYEAMLAKVESWEPPTADHTNLKEFMQQQLRDSIEGDCWDSEFYESCYKMPPSSPDEWRAVRLAEATQSLAYAQQSLADEINRANSRTAWIRQLRESLEVAV